MAKKVDLDKLIEDLDPEKLAEEVAEEGHGEAWRTYKPPLKSESHDHFVAEVKKYARHHLEATGRKDVSEDDAFNIAYAILEGDKDGGGWKGAIKRARRKGGMEKVLEDIKKGIESQSIAKKSRHIIYSAIDPNDFDQGVDFATQYLDKYRSILPKGMETVKPEELAQSPEQVLEFHQEVVQKVKGAIGKYKPSDKDKQ